MDRAAEGGARLRRLQRPRHRDGARVVSALVVAQLAAVPLVSANPVGLQDLEVSVGRHRLVASAPQGAPGRGHERGGAVLMTDQPTVELLPGISVTAEEAAEFKQKLADLHAHGYVDIEEHRALRVGARIRHTGHQWFEAITEGTGYILALTQNANSSWSREYRRPDIELIALFDESLGRHCRLSEIANYHAIVVETEPAPEKPVA